MSIPEFAKIYNRPTAPAFEELLQPYGDCKTTDYIDDPGGLPWSFAFSQI